MRANTNGSAKERQTTIMPEPTQTASAQIAANGVQTGGDFAKLMSAIISDVLSGRMTPGTANAAVNAGGKLLKVVEMQLKYGRASGANGEKTLELTPAPVETPEGIKQQLQALFQKVEAMEASKDS